MRMNFVRGSNLQQDFDCLSETLYTRIVCKAFIFFILKNSLDSFIIISQFEIIL